jgi:hypothetical protein
MRMIAKCVLAASAGIVGCSSSGSDSAACPTDQPLLGASYDIYKSLFSFGAKPTEIITSLLDRWQGPDGAVGIFHNGYAQGILNGNAPEKAFSTLSLPTAALTAYVSAYFETMGVGSCQIIGSQIVDGGSMGLSRSIHGIAVEESIAVAIFDVDRLSTSETFYWPEIPATVVIAAVALQEKLADPQALATYKAKLPVDAQGSGKVVIHHTQGANVLDPFQAVATYDVFMNGVAYLSFDADGNTVTLP